MKRLSFVAALLTATFITSQVDAGCNRQPLRKGLRAVGAVVSAPFRVAKNAVKRVKTKACR